MRNFRKGYSFTYPQSSIIKALGIFPAGKIFISTILITTFRYLMFALTIGLVPALCFGQESSGITIQAENFSEQQGIQTEPTSDINGGRNVGWTDAGDWVSYIHNIDSSRQYAITYRVASQQSGGQFQLTNRRTGLVYDTVTVPVTGAWQRWADVTHTVSLPAGNDGLLIKVTRGGFNLNWMRLTPLSIENEANSPSSDHTDVRQVIYPASSALGGSGVLGCIGSGYCTDESWGVDLNWNTGYKWTMSRADEEDADLFVKVSVPSGDRSMSLWLNDVRIGTVRSDATVSPRPTGSEFGPYSVTLLSGENILELRDTEGTSELDVHHVRVARKQNEDVYVQVDKAMDYVFLHVNGIEKMRWVRSTINNEQQQNPSDSALDNLGVKLNITSLLAEGDNEVKLVAAADSWYRLNGGYSIKLWQGETLLLNESQDLTLNDRFSGVLFEQTLMVSKGLDSNALKLSIESNVGGEAIYINNVYTGRRAPAMFDVAPGEYTVGLGEYVTGTGVPKQKPDWWNEKGIQGHFYQQIVSVDKHSVTLERSSMPRLAQQSSWKVAVVMYANMHTVATMSDARAGVAATVDNVGVLTNDDIEVAEASVRATANEWLHEMSYGLSNWDITVLPPIVDRSYRTLDRNDDNGLYWEGVDMPVDLTEFDMVIHLMPNRTASRTLIKDDFGGLGGRPNFYLPATWADAPGSTLVQRLARVRPSPGMLHEALHTYDNSRISDYNGVNQLHGAEEHGYTNTANNCSEWSCWYADYIVSQAPEDTTVLSEVKRTEVNDSSGIAAKVFNPVEDGDASTFVGVFNLIRQGSGANATLPTSGIRNTISNRCLDVDFGSALSGVDILTWGCHGDRNQQWSFKHIADNTFNLMSRGTLKCAIAENRKLVQRTCHTGLSTRFILDYTSEEEFKVMTLDGLCLSVDSADSPVMESCSESSPKQVWAFN